MIRPLEPADVGEVARVHAAAFPASALTWFGPDLLARYYRWQLTGPHDVAAFGAFDGPRLVGFAVAGRFQRAISGFVHANRWRLVWRAISRPWLLARPLVRARMVQGRRWARRRGLPEVATPPSSQTSLGVLAIAVDPAAQRTGLGRDLMVAVEGAAAERGLRHLHLTVEPDNAVAVAFYERLGWRKVEPAGEGWHGQMERILGDRADRTDTA